MDRARLLDLTRGLRRAGRVATGIDRVEMAYLDRFLADDAPVFGLMRTALGYVLLDRDGMAVFRDCMEGRKPWDRPDLISRLPRGRSPAIIRAETTVRRQAVGRCLPGRLRQTLMRHLPPGFDYYNVGHSNLTDRVLAGVKAAKGQVHVLVHDVIPLEYPLFQREGTVGPFRQMVARVGAKADRVIYNSNDTRSRTEARFRGRIPQGIVAHLGTVPPRPDPDQLPQGLPPDRPYFVAVGTIEPRKNHAFLLDLWEQMGPGAPSLILCGSRGWNNHAVFHRLNELPPDSPVQERPGLSDAALAALVQGSRGLLFPTLAEGFGLPVVEALALGARVLCNDLEVLREIAGKNATFAPVSDRELWLNVIRDWEKNPPAVDGNRDFSVPGWSDHFGIVLRLN